jgi:signal peptidase II
MHSAPIRGRLTGFAVLLCVVALDQWSKTAVIAAAKSSAIPTQIFPFFNLVLVWNQGISFGIFNHMQSWGPLLLTSTIATVALTLAAWLCVARDWPTALALGFIIGGALGNITDRVRYGAVADFLDFHWKGYHFWSFNVADSAIFIGVVILVFMSIVTPSMEKESA